MRKWFSVVLCSTFFLLSIVVNSSAEISSAELLRILIEKGIITDEDIKKAEETKKGDEEVVVEAARRPKSVNFKGRVQARYTSIENGDLNKVTSQKAFDEPQFDGFCIRRVRLRWFGNVTDRWKYHVQISADGQENADKLDPATPDYKLKKDDISLMLQDAFFTYDRHPYLNVLVGQYKTRFSPAYLTRGPNLPLCERSLVIDKVGPPTRDIGITVESKKGSYSFDGREHGRLIYERPVYYAVGLYNGNGKNHMRNDNENLMATAMLILRPAKYINFGVSYGYNHIAYDSSTSVLGKAKKVDVDGTYYYMFDVDDDGVVGKRMHYWDFNTALDAGPVHIQVEYIQQHGHGFDRAYGYGIQGQVDLTDTFQLTARYDELDPNVKKDDTFDCRWYTAGFNWFLHGQNVKWQLNYTFREEMHGENVDNDALITHFQVLF